MVDPIKVANGKSIDDFIDSYLPPSETWRSWTHPISLQSYDLSLHPSSALPPSDLDSCFDLIHSTSSSHYHASSIGWSSRSKRREMRLLSLKYLLVRRSCGDLGGFMSFMPTYEDGCRVVYVYEIHLGSELRGSGLGRYLMVLLDGIAHSIEDVEKIMLTCFLSNERAVGFYKGMGYVRDTYSPEPKRLRDGRVVEGDYVILSKEIRREELLEASDDHE